MRPFPLQPDAPSLRRSPYARTLIVALAAVIALTGFFQHSPRIDRAAVAAEANADVDTSRSTWDVQTLSILLASETDRLCDRGTDPTSGSALALGWMLDEQGEEHAPSAGTLHVTHDVSECARRGMRTSGRHPPL